MARSSAEVPSIVVAIGTSRVRWSMVQKRIKNTRNSACDCAKARPFIIYKPVSFEEPVSETRRRYRFALRCFRGRRCTAAGRSGCSAGTAKKSSHPWHFRCWSLRRNELECTDLVHSTGALHRFSSLDAITVVGSVLEKHFDGDFTPDQEKEITFKRWPPGYQSWKLGLALNGLSLPCPPSHPLLPWARVLSRQARLFWSGNLAKWRRERTWARMSAREWNSMATVMVTQNGASAHSPCGQAADKNFFTWHLTKDKDICSPGISYFGKVSTKRKKQCMHQLIEDKGSLDGGCDRLRLRLQCLGFAARLRRSSALCGCPPCLELDQAENNPRVTLLPLRVTDRDKCEKGDDIPRVQENIMAKPQKNLCFVQRQRKKRFLLPKDTRKLVVIDEEEPEAPRLSSCSSVWGICGKLWTSRIFCGTFFSDETLVETLETHPPTRHTLHNAMMWLSVVPGARPGREQPARNTTSTPRNRSGQVRKGRWHSTCPGKYYG